MSAARGLISDFGGVLTSPLAGAFAQVQAEGGVPVAALGQAMAVVSGADGAHPLFELECGRLTERDFLTRLEGALEPILGHPVSLAEFPERYFAGLSPNPELFDYYREVHGRGVRLSLCTNNVREWEPRWRPMFPFDDIFTDVVDSGFVGLRKPDPAIYALTLERMGLPAADVVFVDDVEINIDAAREAGMRAVHFETNEQAIPLIEAALARDD